MDRFQCELLARCAQVAFFVEITSEKFDGGTSQNGDEVVGKEGVHTEVKFSLGDQIGIRDVLLQHHSLILTVVLVIDRLDNFLHVVKDLNAVATVCILTRFQDPDVVARHPLKFF